MITFKNIYLLLNNREKKKFNILIFLSILSAIMETFGIAILIPVLNLLTEGKDDLAIIEKFEFTKNMETIQIVLLVLLVIFFFYIIKNIFLSFYYYYETKFSYEVRYNLGGRVFKNFFGKNFSFHLATHTSKIINRVNNETTLFGNSIMNLSSLISESLVLIGISTLLFFLKPTETSVVFSIIIILSILFYVFFKKTNTKLGRELAENQKKRMKVLSESLDLKREILLYRVKNYFITKFENINNYVSKINYNFIFITRLPKLYFEIMVLLIITLLVFVSSLNSENNSNILNTLSIFILSSIKIIPSINKIINSLQKIKYSEATVLNLKNTFEYNSSFDTSKNIKTNKELAFNKKIVLKNISYRYEKNKEFAIKNLNLQIQPGDFISIIGESGSGKTTLLNLLMGLIKPTDGIVKTDDLDIEENLDFWRSKIGYVPQNIYMLDESIKKNIAFGKDENEIFDQKIVEVCKKVKIHDFIKSLKNQYDEVIGQDASRISGGQKQRIALARALYKDPKLLILDEPTSAMDDDTAGEIMGTLKDLNKTMTIIQVTHKKNFNNFYNKIYEMKNNNLEEINIVNNRD